MILGDDFEAKVEAELSGTVKPALRWIEWGGGDFLPVPPEMKVTVLLRDGSVEGPARAREFGGRDSCWRHRAAGGDIVAYTGDLLFPLADPTEAMIEAALQADWECDGDERAAAINVWHAMTAAFRNQQKSI